MRLWAAAHAIDDMYQGLVPASVPYFVLDRHYSYVAASGLALAATLGSSLPQPVIGLLVDKWRLGWMAAAGVSLAGAGAGLSGLAPAYPMVWLLLLASGLGVAMFHPAAGKSARADAGGSASAMSIFAAGGSAGFFLAPVGLAANIPFSVMIKLGQDYLPSRPGTATGVTLGLAVSVGGLFAPVLGAIAEAHGIAAVFTVLCFVPGLALILGALLPDPAAPAGEATSRHAPADRRGTPRSLLPGRGRGR